MVVSVLRQLRKKGILGINARNANYIFPYNQRKFFPRADSKLRSKRLAQQGGIPVPELYGTVDSARDVGLVERLLQEHGDMVIKPEHGSGGEGILLLSHTSEGMISPSGVRYNTELLRSHLSDVSAGLYSLGGQADRALLEYKVVFDPVFDHLTYKGVPDIRTIVFQGVPVCAMMRLPTRRSDGKANIHQGAIGVGVCLLTGKTLDGVDGAKRITHHPDTGAPLAGNQIPYWGAILDIATRCFELFQLGYMGIDLVLDEQFGPMLLEVNVRPGLAIQIANDRGLVPRLQRVEMSLERLRTREQRLSFVEELVDLF